MQKNSANAALEWAATTAPSSGESPVVTLKSVRFRWPGAAKDCLDLPDISIAAGESVFLHGPSGSGKSTLLSLMGGVVAATAGRVVVLGSDLGKLSPAARDGFRADHFGFIFQQFNLIPYLTAGDNIRLACRFSAARRQRIAAGGGTIESELSRLAARLELTPLLERPAAELSVGQQQRVAAARALIGRPPLIIADEPTSALDADRQLAFLDLLRAECRDAAATLLFVSHDLRLARHFDREIALSELNRIPQTVLP